MSLTFDQPNLLWLALIALPLLYIGWRATAGLDRLRRTTVLGLRTLTLLAVVVVLAGPHMRQEHDRLTVVGLLDISGSVRRFAQLPPLDPSASRQARQTYVQHLREWFRRAVDEKTPDDRFGLVVFDGEAIAVAAPTTSASLDRGLDVTMVPGTNIADAIRLGLAMFPADTARRLVLVSDGNETIGSAMRAAQEAAGGNGNDAGPASVPIDIVPIAYQVTGDVQVLSVEAPPNAQPGQTVTVRILLEATQPTRGNLVLRREDVPVDINGAAPGRSRDLEVPAGRSVQLVTVELGDTPVNRLEAIFEPATPGADVLPDNNRAEAFTATPGKGRVLVLDREANRRQNALAQMLDQADIPVVVQPPETLPSDLLSMQNDDLIVLDNVPAYELTPQQHELLARYVNDLGGGLIMIGGEYGFGAGGWNGTRVEQVMPLEFDPPKELRLPQAALVLVLDRSGSMNRRVAGARATQQEVANEAAALAIESIRADSYIGVVTFDDFAYEYVPLQRTDDPKEIATKVRAITAGGGTNIAPALRKAHEMLRRVDADRKRVVCLSDGQSRGGDLEAIAQRMVADDIKISTIAVGDDADYETLERLSQVGEGEFYPVYNPRGLPRVLVDSVQIINKPLIKESTFTPVVLPTGSNLTAGMSAAPPLGGLVVTAPRDDPTAVIEMTHPDGEPLLARWQVGLGRAAAFTSDVGGAWSDGWTDWPVATAFWTQLARTIARPAVSHEAELVTSISDGRLVMTLEATDREGGFIDYLQVDGTVYTPDGSSTPVRLRQTAPGRYEGSIPARDAGNYIVALNPRRGERQLAPVIGGASRATGEEFRRYRSNLELLDEIVRITDGRRLDPADPQAAELFDRTGMPPSVSLLPAWQTLLWLLIALLLIDVASRRIAWSAETVRGLAARAVARVTPSRVRGSEAAATLSSLRQASTRFDEQLEQQQRGVRKLDRPDPVPMPVRRRPDAPPDEPSPSRISSALGALLGRSKSTEPPPEQTKPPPRQEPKDVPETGSSETTSSLLAAKRRARDQYKRPDRDE